VVGDVLWNLCDWWVLIIDCEPLVIVESCDFSPFGFCWEKIGLPHQTFPRSTVFLAFGIRI
jgi:hypothetical protein